MDKNSYGEGLYSDGVFYFTNPGIFKMRHITEGPKDGSEDADFYTLWNNKEYCFKAKTTVPIVIMGETPEAIQHIRKQFAKNYAQKWFHQSAKYKKLVKEGKNLPATYNEDTELGQVIQQCLTPLPKGKLEVKDLPRGSEKDFRGTKAVSRNADLNAAFADYEPPSLGEM